MIQDKKWGRVRSANRRNQKIFVRKYEMKILLGDHGDRGRIKLKCIISNSN
jgi:hypothetical protein